MNEHKAQNRTYRMKADAIVFVDGFSDSFGVSKSAVIHLGLNVLKEMMERQASSDQTVTMALGMEAQKLDQ